MCGFDLTHKAGARLGCAATEIEVISWVDEIGKLIGDTQVPACRLRSEVVRACIDFVAMRA